ncbi:hypothetical protein MRX96_059024 [Rhipicephalus microplus]
MSPSAVAAGSGQTLGSNEHSGDTSDDSGGITCYKGPDDCAVGFEGGPGSTVIAGATMTLAVAAEEAAHLDCPFARRA